MIAAYRVAVSSCEKITLDIEGRRVPGPGWETSAPEVEMSQAQQAHFKLAREDKPMTMKGSFAKSPSIPERTVEMTPPSRAFSLVRREIKIASNRSNGWMHVLQRNVVIVLVVSIS